jgi:hypothetical protein
MIVWSEMDVKSLPDTSPIQRDKLVNDAHCHQRIEEEVLALPSLK